MTVAQPKQPVTDEERKRILAESVEAVSTIYKMEVKHAGEYDALLSRGKRWAAPSVAIGGAILILYHITVNLIILERGLLFAAIRIISVLVFTGIVYYKLAENYKRCHITVDEFGQKRERHF